MMRTDRRALLAASAMLCAGVAAQAAELDPYAGLLVDLDRAPDEEIALWPNGAPGGAEVQVIEEIVERESPHGLLDRAAHHVTRPLLSRFAAAEPDGSALLLIPGGGYAYVVIDKEGYEGARWLSRRGVTVYVLRYRLPHQGWRAGADTPLQDAQRAMRIIRSRTSIDGVDPERIAVMGFSAGGHLAGSVATRFQAEVYTPIDGADAHSARPDLAAMIYPVVSMDAAITHAGSRRNLIGEQPSDERVRAYSLEKAALADTPPTFLMHAADDRGVPVQNSLAMFGALRAADVPTELHVFERGGHGFGFRVPADNSARAWPQLYLNWAARHGVHRSSEST